ncbi:hypothetical protein WOB87_09555 [Vibrio parahaemolyticus]|uniref:hypothetical protein n=1 Tax=Vibrio harveyi group TaxID=717610 RepID=UPI0020C0D045|nr:hypothetical protein [Vibrio alginolyticus]ELA8470244.1 hypothetical protein [Vibrio alginolyticus]
MKFTLMPAINGWNFYKVEVLDEPELIELAKHRAFRKAPKVAHGDPSGSPRSQQERFSQNFLGALADISCGYLLRKFFEKHNLPITVESYDQVRTDDFQEHDLYDIKIKTGGAESIVEVRSSLCVQKSLAGVINDWHILGPYQSQSKGKTESEKEFYIRPMFHLKNYRDYQKDHQNNMPPMKTYDRSDGLRLFEDGEVDLYILGGATTEIMSSSKAWDEKGETLKQGKTNFRVVLIKDGLQTQDFLNAIAREMLDK